MNRIKFAFVGEYQSQQFLPSGFIRLINNKGDIYEGAFATNFQKHGFCVSFSSHSNKITLGWYKNNVRNGNWMSLNGDDLEIIEQGWYQNDQCIGGMKEDNLYKLFRKE